jgi:serine/threonine-protein kinase
VTAAAARLVNGSVLGPFELDRRIALGGMAEIWSARETASGRRIALKILQPFYADDEGFRAMFQDEVRICLRLRHEHILEVYSAHEIDGHSIQAMELLDGLDVRRILQRSIQASRWVPIPLALYVGRAVAKALAHAHAKKTETGKPLEIVHRDVSPHNVMITSDGGVKILDFGIARAAERLTRTKSGVVKGKISYMAPEQAMAARVTHLTDVFAAGILLWEMLAMKKLFSGTTDSEILRRVVKAEVPPLLTQNPSVPREAAVLIHSMLALSPEERPQSMDLVDAQIAKILATRYEPEESDRAALARWFAGFVEEDRKTPVNTRASTRTDVLDSEDTKTLSGVTTAPGPLSEKE